MKVLVTGGCGYIGSHTSLVLVEAGHDVVVMDNLCNSSVESIRRVELITNTNIPVLVGDIRDRAFLAESFVSHQFDIVLHFAGLKAVGDSVNQSVQYYDVNVGGTICLLLAMEQAGVKKFVFSSSATVYGEQANVPYQETMERGATTNPYGASKSIVESILSDKFNSDKDWSIAVLRYFNPVGAHSSGTIGEDPVGVPNNLMPFMSQVAIGVIDKLSIFGNDYLTPDGTCRRDYIHVMDLARGHAKALDFLNTPCCEIFNLGTGRATSVFELVSAFEQACGSDIPYQIVSRRTGDIAESWSDPSKANRLLGWSADCTVEQMMADSWRWQTNNPKGYRDE